MAIVRRSMSTPLDAYDAPIINEPPKVLERLKMELNDKPYYTDDVYRTYLNENGLAEDEVFNHKTMRKALYQTVYDILESLSNDISLYQKVETQFEKVSDAYSSLEKRLNRLEMRIRSIPDNVDDDSNESKNAVEYMFYTN